MKKCILVLTMLILSFAGKAADGDTIYGHVKRLFKVSSTGTTRWGLLYLPNDFYNSTSTQYPIIVMNHGLGERGSTEADLTKLFAHGPNNIIKRKLWNGQSFNYRDGKTYKFIILSLQHPTWSPSATEIMYVLKNDPLIRSRINYRSINITGLSAGGKQTIYTPLVTQEYANMIATTVPMSPANMADEYWKNFKYTASSKTRVWLFHSPTDTKTLITTSYRYRDSINKYNPGYARFTSYEGGHAGWETFYDPIWRKTISGRLMNIYEYMLFYMKPITAIQTINVTSTTNITSISWTVPDTRPSTKYIIERSFDGKNFEPIGEVKGTEGVNKTYTFKFKF